MSTADWANEEQRSWMSNLARLPATDLCASGWHVIPGTPSAERNSSDTCHCAQTYGYANLAERQAAEQKP